MKIERKTKVKFPTRFGEFILYSYEENGKIHIALVRGNPKKSNILVRVHSECFTGDTLHSSRCDCGKQLEKSMEMIGKQGGVLLYLRQEGRGIGLLNKLKAYELQDQGMDTVEANEKLGFKADMRDYTIGAKILADLGITTMRLLTNNPKKIEGLENYGLKIIERVPVIIKATNTNKKYLQTKKEKLGHIIDSEGFVKKD